MVDNIGQCTTLGYGMAVCTFTAKSRLIFGCNGDRLALGQTNPPVRIDDPDADSKLARTTNKIDARLSSDIRMLAGTRCRYFS